MKWHQSDATAVSFCVRVALISAGLETEEWILVTKVIAEKNF